MISTLDSSPQQVELIYSRQSFTGLLFSAEASERFPLLRHCRSPSGALASWPSGLCLGAGQDRALYAPATDAPLLLCQAAGVLSRAPGSYLLLCNRADLPVGEAITLLKKAAASKKIAKQQVMEAIEVLETAKLDVRAAEQAFWQSLLQHAARPYLATGQCCRMHCTCL